jgi:hypothetical protein
VSQLANELRNKYNGQVSVVDDGTEHPHRLSLTMRSDVADRITQKWSEGLKASGVKVSHAHCVFVNVKHTLGVGLGAVAGAGPGSGRGAAEDAKCNWGARGPLT